MVEKRFPFFRKKIALFWKKSSGFFLEKGSCSFSGKRIAFLEKGWKSSSLMRKKDFLFFRWNQLILFRGKTFSVRKRVSFPHGKEKYPFSMEKDERSIGLLGKREVS